MYYPDKKEFIKLSSKGNVIPVYKEIFADFDTPLSAFMKIDDKRHSFLLESVEGAEKISRYSFLSSDPAAVIEAKGGTVRIKKKNGTTIIKSSNPLDEIAGFMKQFSFVEVKGLPRFCGGLVGYIGYDIVRFIEKLPLPRKDDLHVPDLRLMLTDTLLVFDHIRHTIKIVSNAFIPASSKAPASDFYDKSVSKIEVLARRLRAPFKNNFSSMDKPAPAAEISSNISKSDFKKSVLKAKEYIRSGDIIQVVLSQRFQAEYDKNPINLYRALRSINPSPYMFYLSFKDFKLIGSSPEIMVRKENAIARVRPIAGTRPRGRDEKQDAEFEKSLLRDKKENAEHLMLVDLGRNDLGRVCRPGSVRVNDFMVIEKYSHVMHIVSDCSGVLLPPADMTRLLRASFPAGTVTGAPKIRAMQIINELEGAKRGPYAGCVGYLSFSGNLDVCITIRTILLQGSKAYVQVGAGIVADSIPEKEYQETVNKAKAMFKAISMANT
ncbi:MAG: anthranilate synthase component I [Candidatus Omnitrophica bacterium]|nr:anthranilate synthase component I [Candidatus Omnitrophota bacterium]